jgi:hypothetical protein
VILPASQRPLPVSKWGRKCFGFEWIGQPFSSCDNCGNPYWVHSHEARQAKGKRFGHQVRVIISVEAATECYKKWGDGQA